MIKHKHNDSMHTPHALRAMADMLASIHVYMHHGGSRKESIQSGRMSTYREGGVSEHTVRA